MSTTRSLALTLSFLAAAALSGCMAAGEASRTSTVPTTSAEVSGQCRNRGTDCRYDAECCSGNCDYDEHYCH